MKLYCGCLLCCYPFHFFVFYSILIYLSTLCHYNSSEVDSWSQIRVPPCGGVLIYQFALFRLSIIINSLFISWRVSKVWFSTVPYNDPQRRMFLDGYWVTPFAWIITTWSLVFVVSNLIGVSVSSAIWFLPFEDVWVYSVGIYCKLIPDWIGLTRAQILFPDQWRTWIQNQIRNTTWRSI